MMRDLQTLARTVGGTLHGANREFAAVCIDTRTLGAGALFVALRGERHDAHEFVPAAGRAGAAGALVARLAEPALATGLSQVVVADVLGALSRYANTWRSSFTLPVIGITGSNGKTTAKEMTGAILGRRGPTLVTEGNLNNHIGVPLMLCRIDATHRHAVIEMGANHACEIAQLAALAEPDVGVVLNAGPAHLEGFGDLAGVARAKGELFESLAPSGTAIINADDDYADFWRGLARRVRRIVSFGIDQDADFRASGIATAASESGTTTSFDLACALGSRQLRIALAGRHNVLNALAAAAAAASAGAGLDEIDAGLDSMRPVAGRLELKRTRQGARLVDDSYNANPGSMRAGLDALAALPGEHWFVMGEMAELGDGADAEHIRIGEHARATGVARLLAIGLPSRLAVEAFGAGAQWFAGLDGLIATLQSDLTPQVTVFVKGSRVNRLERVAAALADTNGPATRGAH